MKCPKCLEKIELETKKDCDTGMYENYWFCEEHGRVDPTKSIMNGPEFYGFNPVVHIPTPPDFEIRLPDKQDMVKEMQRTHDWFFERMREQIKRSHEDLITKGFGTIKVPKFNSKFNNKEDQNETDS